MNLQGYVDEITLDQVKGWVFDPEAPDTPIDVELIIDGEVIATGRADIFRSDLRDAGLGSGHCAFTIPISTMGEQIHCRVKDFVIPRSGEEHATLERKAGRYWDTIKDVIALMPPRARWSESPRIVRDHNNRVCGRDIEGSSRGIIELFRDVAGHMLPVGRGVSVGCGPALKELLLLQEGIVSHFDLFDVSLESIQTGKIIAGDRGVADKATFIHGYDFQALAGPYELVYWDNALHHMFDADSAVRWSYDVLKPGGWLLMADFVGANRFQWSSETYDLVDLIRSSLPDYCFRNPINPAQPYERRPHRVTLEEMDYDPSEAADSEAIIPAIERYFPDALIKHVGGTIYHMALNDVLTNIPDDSELLNYLLRLDRNIDIPHFAVALAQKPYGVA